MSGHHTAKLEQELLQLGLGLKSALKAEHVSAAQDAWLREEAARRELTVVADREPEPSNVGVSPALGTSLFVGRDPALLRELVAASRVQRNPQASSADKHAAIRRIGSALGYPDCCVEAYVAGREFPDQSLVCLRPAFGTEGVADPLLDLAGNDELVSHVPCSYACQPSIALARETGAALEARDPAAWLARRARMGLPLLLFGNRGMLRLTPQDGSSTEQSRVRFSSADVSTLLDPALVEAFSRADSVELGDGRLTISSGPRRLYEEQRASPLDLPLLLVWGSRPRRRVRLALVDLHRSLIDYMDTMTLAMLSGDLTHLGIQNELIRLYLDRERPSTWRSSTQKLARYLLEGGFTGVVWNMAFDADVAETTRRSGLVSVLLDGRFSGDAGPFDYVLSMPTRQACSRFWRLWAQGEDLPRVPGLFHPGAGGWQRKQLLASIEPPLRPSAETFWPNTQYVTLEGEYRPPVDIWSLCANPGCPYGKKLDDNEHFQGVVVPPEASARGCSFCEEGGDYEGAPALPTMETLLHQLAYIVERAPHGRFIIHERAVFRFLARFLERADPLIRASGRSTGPPEFFVTGRCDEIVREQKHLREALDVARSLGQRVNAYLVGIENFSQRLLDLFNKGSSVEQHVRAVEILRELEESHPGTFTATRSASHGFLLFTPWTRFEELEENAHWLEVTRFWELRSEATLSKLRLYPTVPLYYKARAEGLLEAGYGDGAHDMSLRLGYSREAPWRFEDPRAAAVYRLLLSAVDAYPRGSRELAFFRAAIEAVRRDGQHAQPEPFLASWRDSQPERRGLQTNGVGFGMSLSGRCNLGCPFCNRKHDRPDPGLRPLAERLLEARAARRDHVVLNGAEPLMSPALLVAARAAARAGFRTIALETNTLGLDSARVEKLRKAGVTRILPFLPGWDDASSNQLAREPQAAPLARSAARAIEASELETVPVIPIARHTLPRLPAYIARVEELYPSARAVAVRFFPEQGQLPHQLSDGPGETPIVRLVEAAAAIGLRVVQAGSPIVPPCTLEHTLALRSLFVLDRPAEPAFRRVEACQACSLSSRCPGASAEFGEQFPLARLAPVREALPGR
jgi:pyruvate-formate lyase-activating enzyme